MASPLVSIICVCYNHERFVEAAVRSVLAQTYRKIEIIIVDDFSTDGSRDIIAKLKSQYPHLIYIPMEKNVGNCTAFNRGLAASSGEYVVDFSTDDVFLPGRIENQLAFFETLDKSYGVVFTDVLYIDEDGRNLYTHYHYLLKRKLIKRIPEGDVYAAILKSYFISSPSMLVRREVLERLGGYDETLAYEDFDFWIRSSREFKYGFLNEVLTCVRKTAKSLGKSAYSAGDKQLHSTYVVCRKARELNRSEEDHAALIVRVRYELRHAVLSENYYEAELFLSLLKDLTPLNSWDNLLWTLLKMRVPLARLRRLYHGLRYQ